MVMIDHELGNVSLLGRKMGYRSSNDKSEYCRRPPTRKTPPIKTGRNFLKALGEILPRLEPWRVTLVNFSESLSVLNTYMRVGIPLPHLYFRPGVMNLLAIAGHFDSYH